MKRNEIFNKFNFNIEASKFTDLSVINMQYVKINEFLNQGLSLMQPEDRMNLYVNLSLIREQSIKVIDNLTQPFTPLPSMETLQSYDNIIQAVVGFEAFVKSNFAEEFTEEKIAEAFKSKYDELSSQAKQTNETNYGTVETDVDKVINNMTESVTINQSTEKNDITTNEEPNILELNEKLMLANSNINTNEATPVQ